MKIFFKYNKNEVLFALEKLINLCKLLPKNKEFDLEYIAARIGGDIPMTEDILNYLHAGGFYYVDKAGMWYVLDD